MTTRHISISSSIGALSPEELAERATIERLLNIFRRENSSSDTDINTALLDIIKPLLGDYVASNNHTWFALLLKRQGAFLLGQQIYDSAQGYHRYGDAFWHLSADYQLQKKLHSWNELAALLLSEVGEEEPSGPRQQALLLDIANSHEKMARYAHWHRQHPASLLTGEPTEQFLRAEQALVYGHPFHPTPKSSEGFSAQDIQRYAPEMGAQFPLHYIALAPELVVDEWLTPDAAKAALPAAVIAEAQERLGADHAHYQLFPCHPWQATYLLQSTEVQELQERKLLIDLGATGASVYPLSSVRTVCVPDHRYMFKLPLQVRITNFRRTNSEEHVQRSLAASRLLQAALTNWSYDGFTVLLEHGYRGIRPGALSPVTRDWLFENLAVLFRENPLGSTATTPLVVAGLLEPPVHGGVPAIVEAVQYATKSTGGQPTLDLVTTWLRRYLSYTLMPCLELFVVTGISLEAHVQNTLICLQDGWPTGCYVRDMEGVSVSRAHSWFQSLVDEQNPVILSAEESWHRLKYYLLTNHLGHVIATLAYYTGQSEAALWNVVRQCLVRSKLYQNAQGHSYLEDLLQATSLPAKANLISRLQARSEKPLYVPVENVIARKDIHDE